MFYSKSTNGFFNAEIHGSRRLAVLDPNWQRPVVNGMPDPTAAHPMINVNNPACLIPADAVEITLEHHAQLLAAQSEGKQIKADEQGGPVAVEPPPQPPVIPKTVSMRQARLALFGAGKLAAVNAAVAAMPGAAGEAAKIEWEYSSDVHRDKALVKALAPVLGLNDAQLDALFISAAAM